MSSHVQADTGTPVKAVYKHLDCLLQGIHDLHAAGIRDFTVLSPIPRHEIDEIMYGGEPSPVRWFTLIGGIIGGSMIFSLASLTHANWPMIIPGGKPLVSIPPFLVVTFEGTILWASMFTLTGLLLLCGLPATKLPTTMHDPRFTNDCFGIVFERTGKHVAKIVHILEHSGAIEVTHA
jgi:Protein of unknown function (DUF3341)